MHKDCSKWVPAQGPCTAAAVAELSLGKPKWVQCLMWIITLVWVRNALQHHWSWLYYAKNVCKSHGREKWSCVILTRFSLRSAISVWLWETGCDSFCVSLCVCRYACTYINVCSLWVNMCWSLKVTTFSDKPGAVFCRNLLSRNTSLFWRCKFPIGWCVTSGTVSTIYAICWCL